MAPEGAARDLPLRVRPADGHRLRALRGREAVQLQHRAAGGSRPDISRPAGRRGARVGRDRVHRSPAQRAASAARRRPSAAGALAASLAGERGVPRAGTVMTISALRCVAVIAVWAGTLAPLGAQAPPPVAGSQAGRAAPRASVPAYLVVDLQTGRRLGVRREDVIRQAVAPGAIAKIATVLAALESRSLEPGATFVCRRRGVVDGEAVTCSHPSLAHPLTLAEVLAHSCNYALASIASGLSREGLDRALVSLGLAPSDPGVPLGIAALGIRGVRSSPEQLLNAFVRAVGVPAPGLPGTAAARIPDASRRLIVEASRGATEYGPAAAIRAHAITALATTSIAPIPGGRYLTLVVALAPADNPRVGVVVVSQSSSGTDAVAAAADRLQEALVRPTVQKVEPVQEVKVRVGRSRAAGRYEIETVGLEEYVARVVAAEATDGLEARKALAIVARTFALANRERHRAEGFDLCDRAHCLVAGRATSAGRRAAEATRGQVLRFGSNLASVSYTPSCGGQTDRPGQVWKGVVDASYMPSRFEDQCRAPSRWTSEIPTASLARALRSAGMRGQEIRNLWVRSRTAAGRAAWIAVSGFEPREIDGEAFREAIGRTLGSQLLKSARFNVTRTTAGYRFEGYGTGAGVGLCLMGAARAAASGTTADSILATYFPGTTVGAASVPDPRVEVTVPAGAERDREVAAALARRWLKDYSTRLAVAMPAVVSLVFHPTVESYLRATSQPWWTAGWTQGTKVDLLPPSVLRQRGSFERTLRHEIAHVVIGDRLKNRPRWVREAAAMYVSSEIPLQKDEAVDRTAAPAATRSCPSDEEMRRLASAEAMRDAYGRAAACYAEQLAAGRKWDEIR